jgi:glucan phosphorylase
MATLDIPAVGYGIRYDFGIFKQTFENGAHYLDRIWHVDPVPVGERES